MRHALRTIAIFFAALLVADQVGTALLNAAKRQYIAHLEHGAWWPNIYAALELWSFCVYALIFCLLGVGLSCLLKKNYFAVTLSCLLGIGFSTIVFFGEQDLPFASYSHAPTWLWALSWSPFYVPGFACALGAVLAGKLNNYAQRAES